MGGDFLSRSFPFLRGLRPVQKVLLFLAIFFSLLWLSQRSPRRFVPSKCPDRFAVFRRVVGSDLLDKFHDYNTCVYARTFKASPEELWKQLIPVMDQCRKDLLLTDGSLEAFRSEDEIKYHILPNEGSENGGCTVLTVGIGKDVKTEMGIRKRLRDIQWRCSFHGADPNAQKNQEIFKGLGTFYNVVVGNGTRMAPKQSKLKSSKLGYKTKNAPQVELVDFFRKHVHSSPIVDQLLLTSELGMASYFMEGSPLDEEGIEICQVNIDFHGSIDRRLFAKIVRRILREHRWVLFKPLISEHVRFFMLNIQSPTCAERYIVDKF
ncbi:hypothetical protein QR680_017695 [Steinernema hermaphroditum]|uniref:Methyltransf_21 domain-containing protein n=1 Tax=Steinernema hermaphroditum TaxID=289476 RepID=A0AA39LPH8_9BILA|nr:hypothetical protein QR680_017695 [Steinernema hermaphroditum]